MFKLTTTLAAYPIALAVVLFWVALLALACRCDESIAAAVKAGERIDHVDDAVARLDALHAELFGSDE